MAVNLYDYANQLEQALRDSEEYKAIKDAFAKVKENEESKNYSTNSVKLKLVSNKNKCKVKKFLKRIYKSSRTSSSYRKDENISELMNAEQK